MRKRKKNSLMDSATDAAENIRPTIESAVDTAKEKAGPLLQEGRELAVEKASLAREKATPLLQDGRDLAVEKAQQGREYAAEKAPVVKAAARERATQGREYAAEKAPVVKAAALEKVNEMRGIEPEPQKKKGGKLKKLLFVGVLAGLGGFLYKKLSGGGSSQANWQSSYVPAPAPAPATATGSATAAHRASDDAAVDQDDQAAAAPGEAIADANDQPQSATTPDDPAEVIDLDPRNN